MAHDFSFDFYRIVEAGSAELVPLNPHSIICWHLKGWPNLPTHELPNSLILLSSGSDLNYEIGIWDVTTGIGNWIVVTTGTLTNSVPSVIPFPYRGARLYIRSTSTTTQSTILSLKQQESLVSNGTSNGSGIDTSAISQLVAALGGMFADIIFTTTTSYFDLGAYAITPSFTAAYSTIPNSVFLSDSVGTLPKDVTSTSAAFSSNGTFGSSTFGNVVNFILTATNSIGITKTATCPITWVNRAYWGVASSDPVDVTTLGNSALLLTPTNKITVTAGVGQFIYYASRVNSGLLSFWFNGIQGGFELISTLTATNAYGVSESFYLYKSDLPALTTVELEILPV